MAAAETDAARTGAARELEFARLYADHDRLLAERGALDFGDLILRAFQLLHERPHVRERVAGRFQHVLVDEYDDTNFAQGMLLRLLIDEHRQVTLVGADDRFREELPEAKVVKLERSCRSGRRILDAAAAVVPGRKLTGVSGGRVRFWRCRTERAQAQAVAAEAEQLIASGVPPEQICVLVRSVKTEGTVIASALEERALPARVCGSAAYFQRAEVRDVLAWLRALADPNDSGAVVRALSRPPVELRSVDVARLTQLARRRKLDMPSAVAAALEGPQLSEEGRDRARVFLRLYRSASNAFEDRRPDAFVLRLIERIGLRRQQVFATHADTVERLRNIAKLSELATAYMRREPHATARDFTRYLAAVAESGLREEEATGTPTAPAVQVMSMSAARGLEFDHVFVLGLSAARMPGPFRPEADVIPAELLKGRRPARDGREAHEAEMRRLLHLAMTRARKGLVLAWAESGAPGTTPRPSPFYEEAMAAVGRGGGGLRGGAVRPGRGPPLDLPDHARRAARHGRAHGRPPRRDAARHLPRRGPGGLALPRADQGGRADRAREGGADARRRAPGRERDPAPVRHAGAARDPRAVGARQLAARHRARPRRAAGERPERRPSRRSTRSSRAAAAA